MGITLEEDLVNEVILKEAQVMAQHVDFEILKDVLVKSCGWHYIELPTLGSNKRAVDISEWAHAECRGKWKHLGRSWLFERAEDAILFKLTWI